MYMVISDLQHRVLKSNTVNANLLHSQYMVFTFPILLLKFTKKAQILGIRNIPIIRLFGLAVKALDSQSRGPEFKTARWLQSQLSLSSFRGW